MFSSFYKISGNAKELSRGMRDTSKTYLTDDEIHLILEEIRAINADESLFVFNDPAHVDRSTCYDPLTDKVYITRNVFPDLKYGSTHPRDLMSVRAVLAHEYYGHRPHREEYLSTDSTKKLLEWEDECRASIEAARNCPNLLRLDKANLINDAIYRAQEAGMVIELEDDMKEVLYGYPKGSRNIVSEFSKIKFVPESDTGNIDERFDNGGLSQL